MIVALTHGAGSNCDSPLLVAVHDALSAAGRHVLRYNLPYRLKRPAGPPRRGDAERDRAAIADLLAKLRADHPGVAIIAGGHSYGGRQTSMLAAERPELADGLLLLSYPLHPPRNREELRTAHFSENKAPSLFIHGTRDPFGSPDEMRQALATIPARTKLVLLEGAGHELANYKGNLQSGIAAAFGSFFGPPISD